MRRALLLATAKCILDRARQGAELADIMTLVKSAVGMEYMFVGSEDDADAVLQWAIMHHIASRAAKPT